MGVKTYNSNKILCILALGGAILGFETSSMAVFVSSDQFIEYFNIPGSLLQGIIAGSNPAGAFFGCWIAGIVSDRFGRVFTIQLGSVLWIIGSFISVIVTTLWMVIAGRAVKGLSVGIFSAILSVYISEVFPDRKKGLATSVMQLCLTWGIMLMFFLSYFCVNIEGDWSFRVAWGVETIPGLVLFIGTFFLPESPKWLASQGLWQKSSKVMDQIIIASAKSGKKNSGQGKAYGSNSPNNIMNGKLSLKATAKPINNNIGTPVEQNGSLRKAEGDLEKFGDFSKHCNYNDLFTGELKYHLLAGVVTQSVTQLSGIGVLMYYLVFICEMVGMDSSTKFLAASFQYVINVAFTVFPIIWLDKMRRKDVLVFGSVSLGLCISTIGILMGVYGHSVPPINGNESVVWEITGKPGTVCLTLCFLFVAIFASTLSCVAWLYTNEIFPSKAKAKGSAICMSVSWTLNFTLTFLAPVALHYIKWGTFCIFGGFCFAGALIIGLWFPETFGLEESEVEMLFIKRLADPEMGSGDLETKEITDGSFTLDIYQQREESGSALKQQHSHSDIQYDSKKDHRSRSFENNRRTAGSIARTRGNGSASINTSASRPQIRDSIDTLSTTKNGRADTGVESYFQEVNNDLERSLSMASTFLKMKGTPFEESDVGEVSLNVSSFDAGLNLDQSREKDYDGKRFLSDFEVDSNGYGEHGRDVVSSDGALVLSEHYYNATSNESPFLNRYRNSPFGG